MCARGCAFERLRRQAHQGGIFGAQCAVQGGLEEARPGRLDPTFGQFEMEVKPEGLDRGAREAALESHPGN
eukprot:1678401-Alexandrium_andersonii.AAC.1